MFVSYGVESHPSVIASDQRERGNPTVLHSRSRRTVRLLRALRSLAMTCAEDIRGNDTLTPYSKCRVGSALGQANSGTDIKSAPLCRYTPPKRQRPSVPSLGRVLCTSKRGKRQVSAPNGGFAGA